MFERFTQGARQVVVHAQEEARALRSGHIGTGHLLLGVLRTVSLLLPLTAEDVRVRLGGGDAPEGTQLPLTDAARRALELASQEPHRLGHERVAPGHLLLALAADPDIVELTGLDPARLRDEALRHLIHPPERFDLERALRDGSAVAVWLGDREQPIGDLGHPSVDSRLLLAMLAKGGGGAALLREHGLDEATVRSALGGP
jgi:Clp amino terminal domain, pathogenicity island component